MPTNNGKITAPVSVEDVKRTLGVASNDIGYLCSDQHGKINIWSLNKPVDYPALILPDDYDVVVQSNQGIRHKEYKTLNDLMNALDREQYMNEWSYSNVPQGGKNSPYRLTDFVGYDHNAKPPIYRFVFPSAAIQDGTIHVEIQQNKISSADVNQMSIQSFAFLNDCHFGFLFAHPYWDYGENWGGRDWARCAFVSPKTVINDSFVYDVDLSLYSQGGNVNPYSVYPFFVKGVSEYKEYGPIVGGSAEVLHTYTSIGSNSVYYTFPGIGMQTFNAPTADRGLLTHTYMEVAGMEMYEGNNNSIDLLIEIANEANMPITLKENYIYILFADSSTDNNSRHLQDGETKYKLEDFTLDINEQKVLNKGFIPFSDKILAQKKMKILFSWGNGADGYVRTITF